MAEEGKIWISISECHYGKGVRKSIYLQETHGELEMQPSLFLLLLYLRDSMTVLVRFYNI